MTDEQFLCGMWNKAEALAALEAEQKKAKQRSRTLRRRAVWQTVLVALLLVVFACLALANKLDFKLVLLPLCTLLMLGAWFVESRQFSVYLPDAKGENYYEPT